MPALILFDIDGTILRFRQPYSRSIFRDAMFELFNFDIAFEKMPSFAGMTDLRILREIADASGVEFSKIESEIEQVWDFLASRFEKICNADHIDLLPGVAELIETLDRNPDFQLGLLTGNFQRAAYHKLKSYNLSEYFPFGAFGSDNEDRNALPALAIERAAQFYPEINFPDSKTIIIGDSPRDIECARSNGLPSLIVATGGFSRTELLSHEPDAIFDDFKNTNDVVNALINLRAC